MSQQLLAALAPAALELSLSAAAGLQHEAEERDRDWQLRLERAHYLTERAHRQYDAAEPENRLVARDLERRWEEALRAEQRLQEEYARSRSASLRELTEEKLSNFVDGKSQAAWGCLIPSTKTAPAITSLISSDPFNVLHFFDALSISLNTIVRHAVRVPLPFVLEWRRRTVANVDSIGFVVRMWTQCSAGKS